MQGQALANWARPRCALLAAPALPVGGFEELMGRKDAAGHQKQKQRGTFQSDQIDAYRRRVRIEGDALEEVEEDLGDALADWVEAMLDTAAGALGEVINYFLNLNKGERPLRASDLYHVDHPTQPGRNKGPNTGRCIFTQVSQGQLASLRVQKGGAEVEWPVERWPLDSAMTCHLCWLHGFPWLLYPEESPLMLHGSCLPPPNPHPHPNPNPNGPRSRSSFLVAPASTAPWRC